MRKNYFLPIVLIISSFLYGQRPSNIPNIKKIKITGNVFDQESNQPLEYATITLKNNRFPDRIQGGITNEIGKFDLEIFPGKYDVLIEYIGFNTIKYEGELIRENKLKKKFPFLVMSCSKKNVVRGLHIQIKKPQGKFVTVMKGKIFDVALDLRKKSKTFGKIYSCVLSEKNSNSIFIPPGFAHGFQSLDRETYVIYSCTKYRDKKSEITIDLNDKNLKIKWPSKIKILSKKDKKGISFLNYKKNYIK